MQRDIKKLILDETIRLIEERGSSIDSITIRDICEAAGVGTGLINYHFQTKDNLIAQCVQIIIGDVIGRFVAIPRNLDLAPLAKLRYLAKSTCSFLAANPNISRISILSDLTHGSPQDNTSQTISAYFSVLREVCGSGPSDELVMGRTMVLIYSLQAIFMRNATVKEQTGQDFFDQVQRAALIDRVIDSMFS